MPCQKQYTPKQLRERDAARKRSERLEGRDLSIDYSRLDKDRRRRCGKDIGKFGRTYFPAVTYHPYSVTQKELLEDFDYLIRYKGNLGRAAERGGGKTTIAKIAIIYGIVYGLLKWPAIIEANQDEASGTLGDIKEYFELPDVGQADKFGDDFPEVATPIRALERNAGRAGTQTVDKRHTKMKWLEKEVVFPTVILPNGKYSQASGARITVRGADKPIRGLVRKEKRPDLAVLNDIETEESVESLKLTAKIKKNIERAIKGLGGPGSSVGMLILGTLLNNRCLMAQYTDRTLYPMWSGKRYKLVISWPKRREMWDKYLHMLREGSKNGESRAAHKFYQKNRKEMDDGVVVSNPRRFNRSLGPDKKPLEISAIQHVYNLIAEMGGLENFMCEYQNEPPVELRDASRIRQDMIYGKVNGVPRGTIPAWCEKIVGFIDVHDEKLFWTAMGLKTGAIGAVIDYGWERVDSPVRGTVIKSERPRQVDMAIRRALDEFRQWEKENGWPMEDTGEVRHIELGLVDSGYKTDVVYGFCNSAVDGIWRPARGFASKVGSRFISPDRNKKGVRRIGLGHYESYQFQGRTWVLILDSERFKQQTQNGFKVESNTEIGSISLCGDDPSAHQPYAEQICDEVWLPEEQKYVAADGSTRAKNNHWLDCTAGCVAAAAILGLTLAGRVQSTRTKIKLSEIQAARRNG